MNYLICRDALLSDIENTIKNSGCVNHEDEIMDCIKYAPIVDAVEIVRCRDCTHFRAQRIYNSEPMLYVCCRTNGYSCGENHFCAWGVQSLIPMRYRYTAGCVSYYDDGGEKA